MLLPPTKVSCLDRPRLLTLQATNKAIARRAITWVFNSRSRFSAIMSSSSETSVVEITYSSPGARPPVYVAASFTLPAWQPEELGYRIRKNASNKSSYKYEFFKSFHVSVGTWQYKFRLGTGDWWACDEQHEIGTTRLFVIACIPG